jgi:heavy metal sensor kinase
MCCAKRAMTRRPAGLRAKVALTAFLFEAALLLLCFTAIDLLLWRSLRAELRRTAAQELSWLEDFMADHEVGGRDFLLEEMAEHLGSRTGVLMEILENGEVLFRSPGLPAVGDYWMERREFHGFQLGVAVPSSSQIATRRNLRAFMALSGAVGLLVAALLARALAAKATAPLAAIGKAAEQVHEENLSERLPQPERAYQEAERVRTSFNQMLDRLEGAVRKLRQFTADASHELRTPLSVLKLQAQSALSSGALDSNATALLRSQLEEIDALERMIEDLLTLSRLDSEPPPRTPVDLADLVVETVEQFRSMAESKGIDLQVMDLTAAPVEGERSELRRVLQNLLDNALKYTDRGGRVSVALERNGGSVRLRVRDTGAGIPASERERIFERFYRADPSRDRRTGGAGLGLAIVVRIVEYHRGRVSVESDLGKGSSFIVRLPLSGT